MVPDREDLDITLARVEEKVTAIRDRIDEMCKNCEDHNGRIREIENWKSRINGSIAVITVSISLAVSVIVAVIGFLLK